jgi:hypothetical protein
LSQIWKFPTESWIWALSKIWIPTNIDSTFEPQKWADDNLDTTLAPKIWRLRQSARAFGALALTFVAAFAADPVIHWSTLWISGHFTVCYEKSPFS